MAKRPGRGRRRRATGDVGSGQSTAGRAAEASQQAAATAEDAGVSVEELQTGLTVERAAANLNRLADTSDDETSQPPVPPAVFQRVEDSQQQALDAWRGSLEAEASREIDRPKSPAVGRVVYVLTIDRSDPLGEDTFCSTSDVFLVFLEEIPHEMDAAQPAAYQARFGTGVNNSGYLLDRDPGRKFFNRRLRRLVDLTLCELRSLRSRGISKLYCLSRRGRLVFNGWPDINGLQPIPTSSRDGTDAD